MSSVIRDIKKILDKKYDGEYYDGYSIVCDDQTIELLITNMSSCCEDWGYGIKHELKEDNDFIGAVVDSVYWLANDECSIEIKTDRANIQLYVENYHNGYYPHRVFASWKGYTDVQEILRGLPFLPRKIEILDNSFR